MPDINTRRLGVLVALYPGMLPKGTSYQTMKSYINKSRNPSEHKVTQFSQHYGVSIPWLMGSDPQSAFEVIIGQTIELALPPLGRDRDLT